MTLMSRFPLEDGQPRFPGSTRYEHLQWVIAEEDFEVADALDDGASESVIEEIRVRQDAHVAEIVAIPNEDRHL
jgi:hypothetical protein